MKLLSFFIIIKVTFVADCANILYLSNVASPSHFIWCKSILNALHENGHNVTALSGDVEKSKPNLTYLHLDKMYSEIYNGTMDIDFFEYGKLSPTGLFKLYAEISEKSCVGATKSKGYKELLNYPSNFKFDAVIIDFTMGPCMYSFVDKFKYPPLISVSPYFDLARLARTSSGLIYPAFVPGHDLLMTQRMNFIQRLESSITHAIGIIAFKYYIVPTNDKIARKYQPEIPYLEDIERRTGFYLINNSPLVDYKEPIYSNVKLVGGVQIKESKPLPYELKAIADNATNGLILFSLGTNVRSDKLGSERISKILRVFKRHSKFTFLWKFETSELLKNIPQNVKIQPWMPQNDILAHPNTKLFMAHCGLLGVQEAVWHGVPILGFPVFGDQHQNCFRLKDLGVSEKLSILDFTEEELYNAIKNMIQNPKYMKKIKSISSATRDRQQTPLEEAVYWIEWYIRHPEVDLQGPGLEMNIFVRHSFDVFAFVFIIAFIIFYWKIKLFWAFIKYFCLSKKSVDEKQKKN
ncbi:CLUMA_CG015181, isoform A [Clunio marinus]|uniref:UDP-glucuronosyltransferase n=1 Tax=Clunio marinus TaxID=568069 RepID=A0A1J1IRE2_9DIPT|nr:CLUMA_CG015181, isoform A [Clunio marinus]